MYVSVRTSVRACVGAHVLVHVRVIHLETASCPRGHIHNLHPSPCHVVNSTSKDLFFCVQLLGVSGAVLRVQGLFVDMLGHEFSFTSLVLTGQQSSSHTHRARVSQSCCRDWTSGLGSRQNENGDVELASQEMAYFVLYCLPRSDAHTPHHPLHCGHNHQCTASCPP